MEERAKDDASLCLTMAQMNLLPDNRRGSTSLLLVCNRRKGLKFCREQRVSEFVLKEISENQLRSLRWL